MLRDLGHSTVDVGSGAEADEVLAGEKARFDLLVTDYAMPRQSGTDVIKMARKRQRGLPALIITGCADADEVGGRPPDVGLLMKPFTISELSKAVQRAVEPEQAKRRKRA